LDVRRKRSPEESQRSDTEAIFPKSGEERELSWFGTRRVFLSSTFQGEEITARKSRRIKNMNADQFIFSWITIVLSYQGKEGAVLV